MSFFIIMKIRSYPLGFLDLYNDRPRINYVTLLITNRYSSLPFHDRTAHLQLTDELIGDLSPGARADAANQDLERIKELLSLPPNEGVAQDTTSQ